MDIVNLPLDQMWRLGVLGLTLVCLCGVLTGLIAMALHKRARFYEGHRDASQPELDAYWHF